MVLHLEGEQGWEAVGRSCGLKDSGACSGNRTILRQEGRNGNVLTHSQFLKVKGRRKKPEAPLQGEENLLTDKSERWLTSSVIPCPLLEGICYIPLARTSFLSHLFYLLCSVYPSLMFLGIILY